MGAPNPHGPGRLYKNMVCFFVKDGEARFVQIGSGIVLELKYPHNPGEAEYFVPGAHYDDLFVPVAHAGGAPDPPGPPVRKEE